MRVAPTIAIRLATMADAADITDLIEESARSLARGDYTAEVIEAALRSAWGLDTQLLRDGTYYLLSVDGVLAACGGWSFRSTLFGSDAMSSRDSSMLVPGRDAARIRAFFVRPAFARQGLGSCLLRHCERQARSAGFLSLSLGATEPGRRLYRRHGFTEGVPVDYDLGAGHTIRIVPMSKALAPASTVTFAMIRDAARGLPGVESGTSYGTAALKVRGKLLARLHQTEDAMVLRASLLDRQVLMQSQPQTFYITDHYRDHPWVLVRLSAVDPAELPGLLERAWRMVAPGQLATQIKDQ